MCVAPQFTIQATGEAPNYGVSWRYPEHGYLLRYS